MSACIIPCAKTALQLANILLTVQRFAKIIINIFPSKVYGAQDNYKENTNITLEAGTHTAAPKTRGTPKYRYVKKKTVTYKMIIEYVKEKYGFAKPTNKKFANCSNNERDFQKARKSGLSCLHS